jgi:MFS family permease
METKFTEQENLAIINEMIDRARNNIQKGRANSLIYNGYAVAFVAVLNFILLHLLPEADKNWSSSVWWLMVPSFFISKYVGSRVNRSAIVKTQIDGIIGALWNGFAISIVVLLSILFSLALVFQTWHYLAVITPTIMIMTAFAEFGMAKACRFKPFFWGAIGFWIGALLCCFFSYFVLKKGDIQFLILALCMILGFVIPGNQLNKKAKENVPGT